MRPYSYGDIGQRGTIERVYYTTKDADGAEKRKYANVYLPYGYDEADTSKKYDIFYLIHGGGGNADAWLDSCHVKNMLDRTIASGEAKPVIFVFPSFYKDDTTRTGGPVRDVENAKVLGFMPELTEDLLPAVEGIYHGYAADVTDAGLRAARAHRGFGGFSMGSCATWYAFINKLDYFTEFLPLSGDCWAVEPMGGISRPEETAKLLSEVGKRMDGWHLYCATGTNDLAYTAMTPLMEAMKKYPDVFRFSDDPAEGNICYDVAEGYNHCYEQVTDYIYTFLPYLFK